MLLSQWWYRKTAVRTREERYILYTKRLSNEIELSSPQQRLFSKTRIVFIVSNSTISLCVLLYLIGSGIWHSLPLPECSINNKRTHLILHCTGQCLREISLLTLSCNSNYSWGVIRPFFHSIYTQISIDLSVITSIISMRNSSCSGASTRFLNHAYRFEDMRRSHVVNA